MRPADFDTLADLLKNRSGLALSDDKGYLLESRIMPIARRRRFRGMEELVEALRKGGDSELENDIVNAMTTNESFFFRDTHPFDQFRDVVLPQLVDARAARHKIRIWSAACSSGQEPYSIAMLLKEMAATLEGRPVEIVATDISDEILEKAQYGVYSQFEVQRGLPVQLLMKYFAKAGDEWKIDESIRAMVTFRKFNLLNDMAGLGTFDVIFCRNVLIYFDLPTKAKTLSRIRAQIADDGVLFLGGAETVRGISEEFRPLAGAKGLYGTVPAGERRAAI